MVRAAKQRRLGFTLNREEQRAPIAIGFAYTARHQNLLAKHDERLPGSDGITQRSTQQRRHIPASTLVSERQTRCKRNENQSNECERSRFAVGGVYFFGAVCQTEDSHLSYPCL